MNALAAKAGSHVPSVSTTGDVTITIPHGKVLSRKSLKNEALLLPHLIYHFPKQKPTDDHWIQHIFVADCEGDSVKSIVFHREVAFADSDKPSFTIAGSEFEAAAKAAAGKLRAFEYCTKVAPYPF